jgi:8-amino-7-oxononanoate synthase
MSKSVEEYIQQKLKQRGDENNFRSLQAVTGLTDFYSNDYLGFARDEGLKQSIETEIKLHPHLWVGSTGSRLLSGNSPYVESLEKFLATFHNAESALLFNSGFDANYGLLSTLPYRGDTIIYDELVHASVHDGMRNSRAEASPFAHNNTGSLEEQLSKATGLKYVIVESVYSMDGDFAPLMEITALCDKYDAALIVDEAHATGIFGPQGEGRVCELKLEKKCAARIHTFGKALGVQGAAILGNETLKKFLVNYCRPFIFSTALPFHTLAAIKCAYKLLPHVSDRRKTLFDLIGFFASHVSSTGPAHHIKSSSPIQSLVLAGNEEVKQLAGNIQQAGFDVRPILYPTVAKGSERIRICLHSFNTDKEVAKLVEVINHFEIKTT